MAIEIDQSGKIEQTNKDTVLALSNDVTDTILISAKTKRQLQEIFRRHGQIKNFILFTFSAALTLLIKRNTKMPARIIVDHEYPGKNAAIKEIVLETFKEEKQKPEILFSFIGKRSPAHYLALTTANKKLRPRKIIALGEILDQIKSTEVGKRLKNA